jgi:hypothetical protein
MDKEEIEQEEQGNLIPVVKWARKNYASKHQKKIEIDKIIMEEEIEGEKLSFKNYQKEDSNIKKRHPNFCHRWANGRRRK